ncbi:hypothetical protein SZ64_08005 [Erythrobacter sp. SG61-1L]|nr:hypothetical protein SZ64_08005 [Erythrobacter sp. SG61-1L]
MFIVEHVTMKAGKGCNDCTILSDLQLFVTSSDLVTPTADCRLPLETNLRQQCGSLDGFQRQL